MNALTRRVARAAVTGVAALGLLATPTLALSGPVTTQDDARPCYNGIVPGNPYVPSCNFPPRKPKVRGGTPDQAAVIACRDWPGCLSWYINYPH